MGGNLNIVMFIATVNKADGQVNQDVLFEKQISLQTFQFRLIAVPLISIMQASDLGGQIGAE